MSRELAALKYEEKAAKWEDKAMRCSGKKATCYELKAAKCKRKAQSIREGSCFIATAVYGNYNDPSVLVFREYRDNVLYQNRAGNLFINVYYAIGPYLAIPVKKIPFLKKCCKLILEYIKKRI